MTAAIKTAVFGNTPENAKSLKSPYQVSFNISLVLLKVVADLSHSSLVSLIL